MPRALDDFTPFGYLRNPGHVATSWAQTRGGNLRTAADVVGVEWVYPVGRDARTRCGLAIHMQLGTRLYRNRSEFDGLGLTSRCHTSQIMGFDWHTDGVSVEARYFLVDDDALGLQIALRNTTNEPRTAVLQVVRYGDDDSALPGPHSARTEVPESVTLPPGARHELFATLARGVSMVEARDRSSAMLPMAADVLQRLSAEDAAFAAHCPQLAGDWPAHWREGLHHDFQTSRMLVQPPGGIFRDVWPAWMVAWPRVVLAEGVLDMVRLAYADVVFSQRAVLSLFRDAPAPNVPCVFRNGEYNMIAAGGSRCGTSPAWCLPFLQVEALFLRTLDRRWLGELYPLLAAYLQWWLTNRVDREGWLVYKCTWESGEDGSPRLDPTGSGDADISSRVRPVELQATMAHAAGVMAFFAVELGIPSDEWVALQADFRARTRVLFDHSTGRYRDWLSAEQRFQAPCPETPYWGNDGCRSSVQSLTPLLLGEPLAATEIWRHASPPWTLWPSWTTSLLESAAAAGEYSRVGSLAAETIDRVYRVTTRRDVASLARPLPGSAPEFWPLDWQTYDGNDGYGWGAQTATLLLRHVVGYKESRQTDGWVIELTPALPPHLLTRGSHYLVRQLSYRGLVFDLGYHIGDESRSVEVEIQSDSLRAVFEQLAGDRVVASRHWPAAARHVFAVEMGNRYRLRLE